MLDGEGRKRRKGSEVVSFLIHLGSVENYRVQKRASE